MKNRLFLLLVIVVLTTTSAACSRGIINPNPSNSKSTPAPVEKILSSFHAIEGTNYLMAQISANPNMRETSANPLSWISSGYSSYGFDTYNYVFFNLNTETYRRLLPTNDTVIAQIVGFPTPQYDSSDPEKPQPPIEWWLYTLVKADTNQNGFLDFDDTLTLGVSDVGGNGFTEIIADVDRVLGEIYKDDSTLFVIYHAGEKNFIAKIDLPTRKVVSTTEMDLGKDVK